MRQAQGYGASPESRRPMLQVRFRVVMTAVDRTHIRSLIMRGPRVLSRGSVSAHSQQAPRSTAEDHSGLSAQGSNPPLGLRHGYSTHAELVDTSTSRQRVSHFLP